MREIYGLDEEIPFRNVTISLEHRPQPLYLGAATQIGVIPTEGIPSLLQFLLPSSCAGLPLLYVCTTFLVNYCLKLFLLVFCFVSTALNVLFFMYVLYLFSNIEHRR